MNEHAAGTATDADPADLHWLEDGPATETGVTWGVPWARGAVDRDDAFVARDGNGDPLPMQSWVTAYWPDGSVKWTGHAATFDGAAPDGLTVEVLLQEPDNGDRDATADRETVSPDQSLSIDRADDHLAIDTGRIDCRINLEGAEVIREISIDGETVCSGGRLVCTRERREGGGAAEGSRDGTSGTNADEQRFHGRIEDVSLEREGPIRAVVTIEGVHTPVDAPDGAGGEAGSDAPAGTEDDWLPFTLRLVFYAGLGSIDATHTFVFDGDAERDFITGLGLSLDVPMSGPAYNRHVRFGGDDGLFREPARLLPTWAMRSDRDVYARHLDGEPIDPEADTDEGIRWPEAIGDNTPWNTFRLRQESPDDYVIEKTAGEAYSWLEATRGRRSSGLAFAGSETGGVSVAVEDFWETYPSALSVTDLLAEEATVDAWFWSPNADRMDLRRYDEPGRNTMGSAYGGLDEDRSTPHGIANTTELTIACFDRVPDYETLEGHREEIRSPSLPVCEPERYHGVNAFGRWSLEDRSTPERKWIESQLDAAIEWYKTEIEQRRWYGFWDYGDIMHSYDPVRHEWRYDVGGYAWQNTEQVPTLWFWYTFLRSGRADVFRMAAAQTRHTSEVDVYHEGPLAGLGTRHNVQHWGGSCKEVRTSMAGHHRVYYYLTGGDERLGEYFREVRDADYATVDLNPMRNHIPADEHPTHARSAPEWLTFVSNWQTEWERFEAEEYREKIGTGLECLKGMPLRLFSGSTFGYDPETGELFHIGDGNYGYAFLNCMGGPQVWIELADLIDDPEFEEMLAEVGELYLDEEARAERLPEDVATHLDKLPMYAAAYAGFAAELWDDDRLAERAWEILLYDEDERRIDLPIESRTVDRHHTTVEEIPTVKTNIMSIWSLNVIACLEFAGEHLPEPPAE